MKLLLILILACSTAISQTISAYIPKQIKKSDKYLFYLHGQVVTELGNNAVNQSVPEWGPYEYLNILDSLKKRNFTIISEIRQKGIENSVYTTKISKQIDSLLNAGVPAQNIIIVGASAGWDIVLRVSAKQKNKALNFVIMGGCWPNTYKEYVPVELYGRFLSIIEKSDPHGTCYRLFEGRKYLTSHKEILLTTGLSHGFICKGYKQWINPIVHWHQEQ